MSKKQLISDYLNAFETEGGKRVLEDLSKRCYEDLPTYVDQNPTGTAYREGRRGVMLYIRSVLNANPFDERQLEAKE